MIQNDLTFAMWLKRPLDYKADAIAKYFDPQILFIILNLHVFDTFFQMQQQEKIILPLVRYLKRNGVKGKKESCIQIAPYQNPTKCFVFLKKGKGTGI